MGFIAVVLVWKGRQRRQHGSDRYPVAVGEYTRTIHGHTGSTVRQPITVSRLSVAKCRYLSTTRDYPDSAGGLGRDWDWE